MTTRDDFDRTSPEFDRLMTAWFDAEARVREPDDLLDRTVARTGRVRPRPAWLLPERWLPVELTMRQVRLPKMALYLVPLVLLLAAMAVALVAIGSQRRVPAPFGPAVNGQVAFVTEAKDIATIDTVTGEMTVVVGGIDLNRDPVFSRDGTRIAFVRSEEGGDAVYAVNVNGTNLVRLTSEPIPASANSGLLRWSPDGSRVAFQSSGDLWIARSDGSGATRLDLEASVADEIEWRPPNGDELAVRGSLDGKAGLFLVKPDGTDLHPITSLDASSSDFDYLWVSWAPDGNRVAYHIEHRHEIEVLDIATGETVVFKPENVSGLMFPRFSPDGSRLATMVYDGSGSAQIGVFPVDDPTPSVTLTGPTFDDGIQFDWSPDGSEILAVEWGTDQPWILDPAGGPGLEADWSISIPDWVEWQRLAN